MSTPMATTSLPRHCRPTTARPSGRRLWAISASFWRRWRPRRRCWSTCPTVPPAPGRRTRTSPANCSNLTAWGAACDRPDQIARTLRAILLAPEFATSGGAKVRRPLALVAAFARAHGIDLVPTEPLWNEMANAGQRLFGWAPPTGLPDNRADFLGAHAMRRPWTLVLALAGNWLGTGALPLPAVGTTPRQAAEAFLRASLGGPGPEIAAVRA